MSGSSDKTRFSKTSAEPSASIIEGCRAGLPQFVKLILVVVSEET
jgi:hypothetical protein